MKPLIRKLIIFCAASAMVNATAATTELPVYSNQTKSVPSVATNVDLLAYLDQVLTQAGFSAPAKKYLLDLAKANLATVSAGDFAEKQRLLKRNLYIYLQATAEQCKSPAACDVIRREYHLAEQYQDPWDYILSPAVLQSFKKEHIFDTLTVDDIQHSSDKFCQIWPFCEK
jgi:hypothetical protein